MKTEKKKEKKKNPSVYFTNLKLRDSLEVCTPPPLIAIPPRS